MRKMTHASKINQESYEGVENTEREHERNSHAINAY